MSRSVARLVVADGRLVSARADSPQRWNRLHRASDGWLESVHQVAGDGLFGGDLHATRIRAGGGSRLAVRSLTAVPLRGRAPAATAVHIAVEPGASVIYAPGPLLPQCGSNTAHGLTLDVAAGGCALAASIVLGGREGMGEWAAFARLRLRTVVRYAGRMAFAEDAAIVTGSIAFSGPAMFAGALAAVTLLSTGDWPPSAPDWWDQFADSPRAIGGASALRSDGAIYRGLCADLGAASAFVQAVEAAVRASYPA